MNGLSSEYTIRKAVPEDAKAIADIDAACFPGGEAADLSLVEEKIRSLQQHFFVTCCKEKIVNYLNGTCNNSRNLTAEIDEDPSLNDPDGEWMHFLGMATLPEHRGKGIAEAVMSTAIAQAKEEGRKGCVLNCKDHLVAYYEKHFGYVNEGNNGNTCHGVRWNQMRLTF